MSQTSLKHTESAHIGEELMQDSTLELKRRCATVFKMVTQQVFTMDEALEAYDVPQQTYLNYVAGNSMLEIFNGVHTANDTITAMNAITVLAKVLDNMKSKDKRFQHLLVKFHEFVEDQEGKHFKVKSR